MLLSSRIQVVQGNEVFLDNKLLSLLKVWFPCPESISSPVGYFWQIVWRVSTYSTSWDQCLLSHLPKVHFEVLFNLLKYELFPWENNMVIVRNVFILFIDLAAPSLSSAHRISVFTAACGIFSCGMLTYLRHVGSSPLTGDQTLPPCLGSLEF